MSKHWNPRTIEGGRTTARRSRGGHRRGWRISAGELRMMVLGGVFVGLTAVLIPTGFDRGEPAGEAVPAAADPWPGSAEYRQSLEEQEATPDWTPRESADGRAVVRDPSAVVVIDGDTFRLAGEKIRIADIDTPEVNGRCAYESALAARATARMGELLNAGPFEMHSTGRDEDRYGRKLRVVTRGGQSLGDQLVAEGLARTWTGRREPWCA